MTAKPCMGGWCALRDRCPHHEPTGRKPAERLCVPGQDGVVQTLMVDLAQRAPVVVALRRLQWLEAAA